MRGLKVPKNFKKFKPFADQVADGDICDLETAAKILGFSPQHLRRLCATKPPRVPHIRRNGTTLWFEPAHLTAVYKRHG